MKNYDRAENQSADKALYFITIVFKSLNHFTTLHFLLFCLDLLHVNII